MCCGRATFRAAAPRRRSWPNSAGRKPTSWPSAAWPTPIRWCGRRAPASSAQRNVPGAINRLLQLLDSPHQAEREAAQTGLAEFRFERFAANFDNLTPEARGDRRAARPPRRSAGDRPGSRPSWKPPHAAGASGPWKWRWRSSAVAELQTLVAGLLRDEDQYLRVEAIRALAPIDTPAVRQLLRDALLDPQPLVQQAAESALAGADTVPSANAEQRETVRLTGRPPTQVRKTTPPGSVPDPRPTETWSSAQLAALRQ